jgi:hypothetical protein
MKRREYLEHVWESNIKTYLKEIGWGKCGLDSSGQWPAVVNTAMNLPVP